MVTLSTLICFFHKLTEAQKKKLLGKLRVEKISYLPQDLQKIWSNIPPEMHYVGEFILPIKKWLKKNVQAGDYILVQGDYGATYQIVKCDFANNCIPIYATSERKTIEKTDNGQITLVRLFKHVRFRVYEKKDFCR